MREGFLKTGNFLSQVEDGHYERQMRLEQLRISTHGTTK